MEQKQKKSEGRAKLTIEIMPLEQGSRVKPFKKVMEFNINLEDLPLKVSAASARLISSADKLAEEMC